MNPPQAIEVDQQSVLLAWNPVKSALAYELQMLSTPQDGSEEPEWKSLSSAIQGTNIRKKNLVEGVNYKFRVRCKLSTGWDDFSPSSVDMKVLSSGQRQISAPTLLTRDSTSITIEWQPPDIAEEAFEISGYRLRYRDENTMDWTFVDTLLKNTQVKKKSLTPGVNYYFSIMPVVKSSPQQKSDEKDINDDTSASVFAVDKDEKQSEGITYEYSPQSLPFQVQQLSPFMSNLFPTQLIAQDGSKRNTADSLAGKMVAIYFSAHWCGPCRQFTPVLGKVYQELKAAGKTDKFEVVFCSADHAEPEFQSYFRSMAPWLAIDFDDDEREEFMGKFKVQGIPKLVILAPDGRMVTDNAVNPALSPDMIEQWMRQCGL